LRDDCGVNCRPTRCLSIAYIAVVVVATAWVTPASAARHRCPKDAYRSTTRERGGLVRLCLRKKKAKTDPDVRHGPMRAFYNNGRKRVFAAYKDGHLHGPWKAWYRRGKTKAVGAYKDGQLHGEWTRWFRNSLDRGPYLDGVRHGVWTTELYEGGSIVGRYEAGKKHGEWKTTAANGRLTLRQFFESGRRFGTWEGWYASGAKRLKGSFDNGRKTGTWLTWFQSGKMRSRSVHGGDHSLVENFHENGKIASKYGTRHNARHGAYESRYENGQLRSRGRYIADRKHGTWHDYGRKGRELAVKTYRNGVLDGPYRSYRSPVEYVEGTFTNGKRTGQWRVVVKGKVTKTTVYALEAPPAATPTDAIASPKSTGAAP